jgi:hypothetical protein
MILWPWYRRAVKASIIRARRNKTPFKPFVLELTGGARIAVTHQENILVGKDLGAVRKPNDQVILFTPHEVCALYDLRNGRNGK